MAENEKWPTTIDPSLFKAWRMFLRVGDATEIVKVTGFSFPVVSRALKYGYIKNLELEALISKYFQERINQERSRAEHMTKTGAEILANQKPRRARSKGKNVAHFDKDAANM